MCEILTFNHDVLKNNKAEVRELRRQIYRVIGSLGSFEGLLWFVWELLVWGLLS